MVEFVVTDTVLDKMVWCFYNGFMSDGSDIANIIRSRPLSSALKAERERVLPNDEELKALKQIVYFAIQQHLFDAERANNYYHKLKSLRSEQP